MGVLERSMYGSASDRRKGDGAEIPASFPVYSEMEVLFKQPLGIGTIVYPKGSVIPVPGRLNLFLIK
ncbi:TPA: hypothetical protein NV782_004280 [Escherichia coli]|nr:hypothetical protein [Escherichia coli]